MLPQDVDKIASAIANGLAGMDQGLLGCGGLSDPNSFNSDPSFTCERYQCGGLGDFGCYAGFDCGGFTCPAPATFACPEQTFNCEGVVQFYALPCYQFDFANPGG